MFTRPQFEATPPPYSSGYLAFPPAANSDAVAEEARLFRERVKARREKLKAERDELERAEAAKAVADAAWHQAEEARGVRRAQLKEAALKAEIEWERMGGRVRDPNPADAELRRKLDTEANLTPEERTLKRAWEEYDRAWECLADSIRLAKKFTFRKQTFTFEDIPWPALSTPPAADSESPHGMRLGDITAPAVAKFLLHPLRDPQKSRRERLREAVLRYHPDKFEGRVLPRVVAEDRARVQEAVGAVIKCLNELMSNET